MLCSALSSTNFCTVASENDVRSGISALIVATLSSKFSLRSLLFAFSLSTSACILVWRSVSVLTSSPRSFSLASSSSRAFLSRFKSFLYLSTHQSLASSGFSLSLCSYLACSSTRRLSLYFILTSNSSNFSILRVANARSACACISSCFTCSFSASSSSLALVSGSLIRSNFKALWSTSPISTSWSPLLIEATYLWALLSNF